MTAKTWISDLILEQVFPLVFQALLPVVKNNPTHQTLIQILLNLTQRGPVGRFFSFSDIDVMLFSTI